jgi:hypothetical protein
MVELSFPQIWFLHANIGLGIKLMKEQE